MKITTIVGAALIGVTGSVLAITKPFSIQSAKIVVAADCTDSLLIFPTATDILTAADLADHPLHGVEIRMMPLTDVDFNSIYTASLPGRTVLFSNPKDRETEIQGFSQKVADGLTSIRQEITPRRQSSIYKVLLRELNELSASPEQKKLFLIYSDLAENSVDFSIYSRHSQLLLKTHPEEIQKLFKSFGTLSNLKGIDIYIVFKATEKNKDNFILMAGLFQKLFSEAGATVHVGSNLVIETSK